MRPSIAAALLALALPATAAAQSLTIGQANSFVSLDPHFYNAASDKTAAIHLFDRLVDFDDNTKIKPALAVEWHAVQPTVWEFTLRPNVRWQDGTPFTADDVAFTIGRVPNIPNSPGGFDGFVKAITRVEVVNPLTVRFHTTEPFASLPIDLGQIAIVSRHVGTGASSEDYNSGKAVMGTGPYRLVRYAIGDRLELERNDGWWGQKPDWQRVTYRVISSPGARTAALLSGDVDLIDSVPIANLAVVRRDARFAVYSAPTLRTFDLRMNLAPANPPYIADTDGKPMERNPLRALAVRRALTLAIDRQAISDRVMEGACTPTIQWLPPGSFAYAPSLVPQYDAARARALLAEAGLPEGFRMTLHAPSDRYPNGPSVAQAIAQMWTRVGIRTQVETLPWTTFSSRLARREFAISMGGLGVASGEPRYVLLNFLGTRDAAAGRGASNHSGYSNPALDRLVDAAGSEFDDAAREKLLVEATELGINDAISITICQMVAFWAAKKEITMTPRPDERTLAMGIHPRQ